MHVIVQVEQHISESTCKLNAFTVLGEDVVFNLTHVITLINPI